MLIESPSAFGGRWGWLAPVMGCGLALLVVSSTRSTQFGSFASGPTNWLAAVASNQSYAAYVVASFHSEQNSAQAEPIEWVNSHGLPTEPSGVGFLATNRLTR
ncbi:MAG: hypothetical protein U1G07_10370 [Verrucomicrobiota bacterium]